MRKNTSGTVCTSGSCDLILQDLKTIDAGKYTSKVFANGQLLDSYTYDVHVKVSLTGRKGEELMFDELLRDTENVTHFTDPDWTEVWRRGRDVLTDDKNGCLTIKNFSSSDAGIYRVLNPSGGILLTVTVTESGTESKDKLESKHNELDGTEKKYIVTVVLVVVVVVMVMVVVIAFAVIVKRRCQNRSNEHDSYQGVSTQETVQGPRSPNNSKGCLVGLQQICIRSGQHIIPDSNS